jgi:hypothetical protein
VTKNLKKTEKKATQATKKKQVDTQTALQTVAKGAFEAWLQHADQDSGIGIHLSDDGPQVMVNITLKGLSKRIQKQVEQRIWWEVVDHAEALGLGPGDLKNRSDEE